jgi:hypothetical protein
VRHHETVDDDDDKFVLIVGPEEGDWDQDLDKVISKVIPKQDLIQMCTPDYARALKMEATTNGGPGFFSDRRESSRSFAFGDLLIMIRDKNHLVPTSRGRSLLMMDRSGIVVVWAWSPTELWSIVNLNRFPFKN